MYAHEQKMGRRAAWILGGAAVLLLVIAVYLSRFHVWIEYTSDPSFDVEAFLRAHCFPRMVPLRPSAVRRGRTWCVARRAGRVAGCAAVSEKEDYFLLHHDCVHPGHRRRGVGKRLHRARLALCRAADAAKPVRLYILEGNRPAHALRRAFPQFRYVRRTTLPDTSDPTATYLLYQAPGAGAA